MAARGSRQVVLRWIAVGAAAGYVALLGVVAFFVRTETSKSTVGSSSVDGAYVSSLTITTEQSLWQAQGTPIAVIVGLLAVLVLVGAGSLAWRIGHRSARAGLSALVAAGLLGVVAVLGLLSVGVFLMPVVALLVVIGLPLSTFASKQIATQ